MALLFFLEHISIWFTILALGLLSYTRTFHAVFTIAGGVFTRVIVSILKQIIRQPRPYTTTATLSKQKKSYGMPSSHSAVIVYFATFIFLQLFNVKTLSSSVKLLSFFIFIIALLVSWSRVELGHHTTTQVLIGILLGVLLAVFWNNLWISYWMSFERTIGIETIWKFANEFINERIGGIIEY